MYFRKDFEANMKSIQHIARLLISFIFLSWGGRGFPNQNDMIIVNNDKPSFRDNGSRSGWDPTRKTDEERGGKSTIIIMIITIITI